MACRPAEIGHFRARGFTLVELMITVSVLTLLILAAAPSFRSWIFNTRVRASAESLQNGLRLAQSEAVRQSRQVVFGLTATPPVAANPTTAANGRSWLVQTVPNVIEGAGNGRFIRGGPAADATSGIAVTGPRTICFSSLGNLVANAAPADAGATCVAGAVAYTVTHPSSDFPVGRGLQVQVSINGRVRMCDPARSIADSPEGCS